MSDEGYVGRKIRSSPSEGSDIKSNPLSQGFNSDCITLGNAISKKLIKPGMAVVFKDCVFEPIQLSEEMTGKEQQIQCELKEGIAVKDGDGKIFIFSVIKIISEPLILRGRYARANAVDAIKYVVEYVSTEIAKSKMTTISLKEFSEIFNENHLVDSYLKQSGFREVLFLDGDRLYEIDISSSGLSSNEVRIYPGSIKHQVRNIAICIDSAGMNVHIQENAKTTITYLHTYKKNPYNMRVEVSKKR